jgi:RNA polymerase sigma-70 factor (ECF subfamily)
VPTDAEIVAASLADPSAFGEVFERHLDEVHRYLARRVPRDDAGDLAAEVFRLAFAARARFDLDRPSARPWLYGFAANVVRHHLRSRGREHRAVLRLADARALHSPDAGLDIERAIDALDAATRWPLVAAALDALPTDERETLLLYAWEQLSYDEIAEALEVPVGTVRSRLNRARRRLRELLADVGQPPVEHPLRPQPVRTSQEATDHG